MRIVALTIMVSITGVAKAEENSPARFKEDLKSQLQKAKTGSSVLGLLGGTTGAIINGGAQWFLKKVDKGVDDTWDILFFGADDQYKKGEGLTASNKGLLGYLVNELAKSEPLKTAANGFYSRLALQDQEKNFRVERHAVTDRTENNLYELAMSYAKAPRESLLVLATFGHNDKTEALLATVDASEELKNFISTLNAKKPHRNSQLFIPGALNKIVPDVVGERAIVVTSRRCTEKKLDCPGLDEARYYHVIFAAFLACELIHKGDDFVVPGLGRFPEVVTMKVGEHYKKQSILQTYMKHPGARKLWDLGCIEYNQDCRDKKPADWDQTKYQDAYDTLNFFTANILFAKSQYKVGANFGAQVCRK